MKKANIELLIIIILLFSLCIDTYAIEIKAKNLIHHQKDSKFELEGDVVIKSEDTTINCNRATVYDKSYDVIAEGKVFYEDKDTVMNAERVDVNMKTKTGEVYRAVIYFKNGNYWVSSERMTKISEYRYYSNSAKFTTCNPAHQDKKSFSYEMAERESYDWCFRTGMVDITLGSTLDAKDVTYRVKDVPIGYFPKMILPIQKERKSGILMPTIGSSSTKGIRFTPSLYWAIDDDKDLTFGLDYYSKRGIGKSLQYRYINPQGKGEFNIYHLSDRVLDDTQFQIVAKQNYSSGDIIQFADINYAKSRDMFKEYSFTNQDRTQRFLQSSFELSKDFQNSRLFLINQYWIDLKYSDNTITQVLPSAGYYLSPTNIGPFSVNMETTLSNLYRKEGTRAQRLDIMPVISGSFGDGIKVLQRVALRETVYSYNNNDTNDTQKHRETFQYYGKVMSSFIKRYNEMVHIIEPSIEYAYIPPSRNVELFDSVEAFNKMSEFRVSLSNIFRFQNSMIFARINQPYVLLQDESLDHLRTTVFQGAIVSQPFSIRLETSYNINNKILETFYTDLNVNVSDSTSISIGERYNRDNKIMQYRTALNTMLSKKLTLSGDLWYDAKGGGVRDSSLRLRINEQCWGALFTIQRRPRVNDSADYSFYVLVELAGIGAIGKR